MSSLQPKSNDDDDLLDDLLSWNSSSTPPPPPPVTGLSLSSTHVNVAVSKAATTADKDGGDADQKRPAPAAVLSCSEQPSLSLPADIASRLFPHQRDGIKWLYRKHRHARACLLADEMGLGKTIQVCAFLGQLYRQHEIKTTVIIVPPTLLPLWESTLLEWGRLPRSTVEVVHREGKARRVSRWRTLSYGLPRVMVTTYGVLRQDVREMSVGMVDYVVLDEAHLIKNADTDASKAAQQLSTRHKIALTGTPLMNSFQDLWTIFEFMDGDILSISRRNFSKINADLLSGNERDASAGVRQAAEASLAKLRAAIQPYMLRREKKDIGVVGCHKHDTVVWVTLSGVQEQLYRAVLEQHSCEDAPDVAEEGGGADGVVAAASASGPRNALRQVTMLTQVCNHPWLQLTDGALSQALERPIDAGAPCEEVGDVFSGTKLRVALALVQRCIEAGRKVLVFSRSKTLLCILGRLLAAYDVKHTRVDGDIVNTAERSKAVEVFNADPSVKVCLLTTQVGGVGLTFCAASCVVLLDPSWNPAADTQAMDRVHRIGQESGEVFMFRLVTCGTIEERIYRNQVFKSMAAMQSTRSGQGQPEQFFRYFTRMQLRAMFALSDLTTSETAAQLAQLHPAGVAPQVRALTEGVPCVCAVSDNGCVLNESVSQPEDTPSADTAADEWLEEITEEVRSPQSLPSRKRQRSTSAEEAPRGVSTSPRLTPAEATPACAEPLEAFTDIAESTSPAVAPAERGSLTSRSPSSPPSPLRPAELASPCVVPPPALERLSSPLPPPEGPMGTTQDQPTSPPLPRSLEALSWEGRSTSSSPHFQDCESGLSSPTASSVAQSVHALGETGGCS